MAERVGFLAALILKAVGISPEKFSWLDGKSKVQNGSRIGSRIFDSFGLGGVASEV